MSPEEWLATQGKEKTPAILSPEEWMAQQGKKEEKPIALSPEEWLASQKPEPKPEDQSFLRQVADVPLKAVAGVATGVRMIADAFGAGSDVSNSIKGVEDYIGALYSAQSKKDSQEIARIMKEAEDKGVADQVTAAVKAFSVAPIDTVVNALGTSAPAIIAGLGASIFGAGALAATAVGAGVGATMGAGTVKGSIYDAVKDALSKTDMSPEQIEARAQVAQEYGGKNLDMILGGAALGTIGATTGFEPAAARQLAKSIVTKTAAKEAAEKAAEETAKIAGRGAVKQAGITGAKEFAGEAAEGGQEQLAQNIALQREGFDVPTMRGVVGQATLEGLAGLGLGSTAGAREALQAKEELRKKEAGEAIDKFQKTAGVTGTPEERVQNIALELQEKNGLMEEEAVGLAKQIVADEAKQEQAIPAPEGLEDVQADPERIMDLKEQYQSIGMSEADALEEATAVATKEAQDDALAEREAAGEANVGQPISEAGGVSTELAGEPSQEQTAGGAGEPATDGVVPTRADVAVIGEGETVEPVALTPYEEAEDQRQQAYDELQQAQQTVEAAGYDATPEQQAQLTAAQENYNQTNEAAKVAFEQTQDAEVTATEEAAPAAEIAPKGKRGRPAATAEERAAKEADRRTYRAEYTKAERTFSQGKNNILAQLELANKPLDEGEFANEDELEQAQEDKRAEKADAIKRLIEIEQKFRGSALGKRVKAVLDDRSKITPEEIAKVKRAIEVRKKTNLADLRGVSEKGASILAQRTSTGTPDAGFSKAKNGAQALTHIIKTTKNPFQKFLAQRLRSFVSNVNFVVIEKGDPLPQQLQDSVEDWEDARGLFFAGTKTTKPTIYVRGASFGEDQGVNNITVLHELLHAATNAKINLAMIAGAAGVSMDAALTKFVNELTSLMENAKRNYERMRALGLLSPEMRVLVESMGEVDPQTGEVTSDIFELPQEFLAYGMSDENFQDFLDSIEGVTKEESGWSRFTRMIANLFGLGRGNYTLLSDLMHVTDSILTSRKTKEMRKIEKAMVSEEEVFKQAKKVRQKKQKVDALTAKLQKSNLADSIRNGTITDLTKLRDESEFVDVMTSGWKAFSIKSLQQLLPALQTETIVAWADRLGIKGITEAWQGISDMAAMRNKRTNAMIKVADQLQELASKDADQYQKLANVMHATTLSSYDPSTATTPNPRLDKLWNGLTDTSKQLYTEVRDFYKQNHELYHMLLEEQIKQSNLSGNANDPNSPKGKLLAEIKKMYEEGRKMYPYFPLMRYGQYWARVGKGKNGEFQMFESAFDRERFLRARVRQLNESGDTRTLEKMIEDGDIDSGNDLTNARKQDMDASTMLKEIFNSIDAGKKGGTDVDADKLKDEIYQLYLHTLPERSFRRKYIHRQGKAGFGGDIHRNFVVSGTDSASQLARLKYGPRIMNQIERAQSSLQGNPDKSRLGEFVTEMRIRTEQQVRPDPESSIGFAASNLINKSAFLWLMTSIKTMVSQFTAIPIFVAPVLSSKHGMVKTAAALGKSLNIFNGLGITDKDGKFTMPTMSNLTSLTADEKRAAQYMLDHGISETTLAYDLGNRRNQATALNQSTARKILRGTGNAMTALFHHAERMIRELTFMTSYRLNREKGKTHEQALRLAEQESHEALGNYHASNRPRGLLADQEHKVLLDAHKPLGRSLFQFKMFPAFVTTYFVRNFYRAISLESDPKVRKEAAQQFIGSLTMSYALAGMVGIPGISFALGVLQGILNGLRGDDEDDPLEGRDLEFWFRNIWLPKTFGNVKVGDHTLDELLDRGLIAGLTGYDISSSLSMNNMWFPEVKEGATASAEVQDYFMSLVGPGASLFLKQIPKAVDYFNQGKVFQGMETLMPAIFRAPMTAARYGKEGATTTSGAIIKDKDEFTQGQLIAQSLGFATEGLQARREAIFKLQGEVMKVRRERTALMDRLEMEIDKGSDEDVSKAFENIFKFNSKNPMNSIGGDDLSASLKKQMQRKIVSDRGFPIDKKFYPQLIEILEPSSKKLEREAQAAKE
jgi:hypothetical protein